MRRAGKKGFGTRNSLTYARGEGIVISQKPLEVKYRDKDGVLKIAGNIQQNDAGKMELGKRVTITLEDGKLAKCRYKNM